MRDAALRARALLGEWGTALAVLLCVLALTGGWMTYTAHVDPGTATERRSVTTWESTGGYAYAATVTEPNPVFETGRTLPNRTRYYTAVAPALNGTFAFRYAAASARNVTVEAETALVYRAVAEGGEEVYWRQREPLNATTTTLEPGATARVPFAVNVSTLEDRITAVRSELGAQSGTTEAFVRANVTLAGAVGGEPVARELTYRLPIGTAGGAYTVSDPGPVTDRGTRTVTVEVPVSPGPLRGVGGPLLLAVSLPGLAGLAAARRAGTLELTERERALLAYRDDRAALDEWVSRVRLPPSVRERPVAEAETLRDLVDFAIDIDEGVVETPDGTFAVLHGGCRYRYVPPTHSDWPGAPEDGAQDRSGVEPPAVDADGTPDPGEGAVPARADPAPGPRTRD